MKATPIQKLLERKAVSPIYACFGGMSGVIHQSQGPFPHNQEVLGRVLGHARGEGNELSQWILKSNGNVVPRPTVQALQLAVIHSDTEKRKRDVFDALIERRWGSPMSTPNTDDTEMTTDTGENENNDDETTKRHIDIEDSVDSQGALINQLPAYD